MTLQRKYINGDSTKHKRLLSSLAVLGIKLSNKELRVLDREYLLHDAKVAYKALALSVRNAHGNDTNTEYRDLTYAWNRVKELLTRIPHMPKDNAVRKTSRRYYGSTRKKRKKAGALDGL
jgi:hypothetical protein